MGSKRPAKDIIQVRFVYPGVPDQEIYAHPFDVDAEDGAVILKCPEAVDLRMTAGAAEETSERLLEGAMKARGQRYFTNDKRD